MRCKVVLRSDIRSSLTKGVTSVSLRLETKKVEMIRGSVKRACTVGTQAWLLNFYRIKKCTKHDLFCNQNGWRYN